MTDPWAGAVIDLIERTSDALAAPRVALRLDRKLARVLADVDDTAED